MMLMTFVGTALYLFAGRQTFWLIMLSDPDSRDCLVKKALENGEFPKSVFALFTIFWPFLLAYGKAQTMFSKPETHGVDND
ncbi:hypothetical protein SAMN04488103_101410 [Gemmobacter aquatilis]|uniref:Uncharacterized protein n=1 Tax=Gemmobacter aquatilis TaxID=933059 RepID=A0A1H7Z7R0_9RHOB|nr:hypothetical protein [Gemmobacter aquatilis]SEM53608.1 hypothetical protein SAMN04488103_101410 [Gemmobacter aquatilis]